MTVADLIEALKAMPQDAIVIVDKDELYGDLKSVGELRRSWTFPSLACDADPCTPGTVPAVWLDPEP